MRRASLLIAVLLLLVQDAVGSCHANCEKGHKGVCVERDGHCECSCIEEITEAPAEARALLAMVGVSPAGVEEGVQLVRAKVKAGEGSFTVTFTDKGKIVTIKVTDGSPKSNDGITVT